MIRLLCILMLCTSCIEYVGDVDSVGYSAAICSAKNSVPTNKFGDRISESTTLLQGKGYAKKGERFETDHPFSGRHENGRRS